jgi:hypothetical protein
VAERPFFSMILGGKSSVGFLGKWSGGVFSATQENENELTKMPIWLDYRDLTGVQDGKRAAATRTLRERKEIRPRHNQRRSVGGRSAARSAARSAGGEARSACAEFAVQAEPGSSLRLVQRGEVPVAR